jgi:hypothetical protein
MAAQQPFDAPVAARGGAGGEKARRRLHEELERFVARFAGRARQRSEGWLAAKASSIGGSEIAALMGLNPYSTPADVVAAKAGLKPFGGNVACWWGTMFEAVVERAVELDCGTELLGTDISVPAPPESGLEGLHANSPDGYAAVALYEGPPAGAPEGEVGWRLLTTDAETRAAAAGRPVEWAAALLEFKSPYRRLPKGEVPGHYRPQLWSGLALSPPASLGLFVDAAFRKCSLADLGPGRAYDAGYHRERRPRHWDGPVAWGLTGVFAPRPDAPPTGDAGADWLRARAAQAAWALAAKALGCVGPPPHVAAAAGQPFCPDPVDFGDCPPAAFDELMALLGDGRCRARHLDPCFPDGRGGPLRTAAAIGRAVDGLGAAADEGWYFLGFIPWKLFELDYAFVERRPGFLEEIAPLVRGCLEAAARIRAAPDPAAALRAHAPPPAPKSARPAPAGAPDDDPGPDPAAETAGGAAFTAADLLGDEPG